MPAVVEKKEAYKLVDSLAGRKKDVGVVRGKYGLSS